MESQLATASVRLGLGGLANPLRVQHRREHEREGVDDDGATRRRWCMSSEAEVDEGGDALRTEGVDHHQPDGERSRLRHGRQALESGMTLVSVV